MKADFCLRWFHCRRKLGEGKGPLAAVERDIAPYPVFIGNHPVGEGAHRFAVPQGDEQKGELKQGGQEHQEITNPVDGRKKKGVQQPDGKPVAGPGFLGLSIHNASLRIFYQVNCAAAAFLLEAIAKSDFTVILNRI